MINNQSDVTIAPAPPNSYLNYVAYNYQLDKNRSKSCYNTPTAQLLKGRGTECTRELCRCITTCEGPGRDLEYVPWPGASSDFGCPYSKEWSNIQQFCGPPQTQGFYNDGAWYDRLPAGSYHASIGPQHIGPNVYSLGMYGA